MNTGSLRLITVAGIALVLGPMVASAVPTLRGATGLVTIPTASIVRSTAAFLRQGKLVGSYTQTLGFAEGGITNSEGKNLYDLKLNPIPDVSSGEMWIPAAAVGIRGVSGSNENREYYFTLSKKFTYPQSTVTFGMSRAVNWSKGISRAFYGIDVPLFLGLELVAERDSRSDFFNAGVRWVFGKTFCIYDYQLDVTKRSPVSGTRQNVIGICYQNQF